MAQRNILLLRNKASGRNMQRKGFAPLAARPGGQLSIVQFANRLRVFKVHKANRFVLTKRLPPSNPFLITVHQTKKDIPRGISFFVAQRKGFEPLYTFLHNTISNRARSTAPPSLQTAFILYRIPFQKATVFMLFSRIFL